MSKLNEFFYGAKQDKLTDKAFTQSITVCIMSILLCVVALCSTTWAWFSDGVSSNANSIQSASCDVTVSVANGTTPEEPADDGVYTLANETTYTITITAKGTAKSAYCILKIDDTQYYTQQIAVSEQGGVMTFTLEFTNQTAVKILPRWGTYNISNEARDFYSGKSYKNPAKGTN